jgi:RHS repeat-associated protein
MSPFLAPVEGSKKLEFKYDYLGRRVEKKVFDWNETTGWDDDPSLWRRFVYYNWLPLLELNVEEVGGSETVTVLRKYTWGLDLAGQSGPGNSIDEAGGIGGLLATYDTAGTPETTDDASYYYLYDANGNVVQVLDASDGTVAANYDCDAYGNRLNTPDSGEYDQPFRFSTKYWDDETGLGYWGYRYYSSRLGRWLSRDLIEEEGGFNLYCHALNQPPNLVDRLGLQSTQPASSPSSQPRDCCGPDITKALTHFMGSLKAWFENKLLPPEQYQLCNGMVSMGGWDIRQLHLRRVRADGCGTGQCKDTVWVGGACWMMADVNYALWGVLNCLCSQLGDERNLFGAVGLAEKHKLKSYGVRPRTTWALPISPWIRWGWRQGGCKSEENDDPGYSFADFPPSQGPIRERPVPSGAPEDTTPPTETKPIWDSGCGQCAPCGKTWSGFFEVQLLFGGSSQKLHWYRWAAYKSLSGTMEPRSRILTDSEDGLVEAP